MYVIRIQFRLEYFHDRGEVYFIYDIYLCIKYQLDVHKVSHSLELCYTYV